MINIKEHQQVWSVSFLIKAGAGISMNEKLDEELHKPVTKKFKRRKVYMRFKGNIWAADSTEMGSLY